MAHRVQHCLVHVASISRANGQEAEEAAPDQVLIKSSLRDSPPTIGVASVAWTKRYEIQLITSTLSDWCGEARPSSPSKGITAGGH